jgi:hypothetical protein
VVLGPFAVTLRAEWAEGESRTEPSDISGLVHHHVVFANPSSGTEVTLELARFSAKSVRIQLIDNQDGNRDLAGAMNTDNCLAGVNGGYFDENFGPLGLRISQGNILVPLVRGRLMTGVFTFSDGQARIIRASEFSKRDHPAVALQCGPFLVDRGRAVKGLNNTRMARRTFAATATAGQVVLGCSSDLSLAELSDLLATAGDLKIQQALNFDGGSSTAFWFKRKDGTAFSVREQKPVRDYIGLRAR